MRIVRQTITAALLLSIGAAGQGRRGVPNATPEQTAAIARINGVLAPQTGRLAEARAGVVAAALAQPRDDAAIGHA